MNKFLYHLDDIPTIDTGVPQNPTLEEKVDILWKAYLKSAS